MTLRKEHGKRVYQFAWVVEWSLFSMAIIVAGLNIYTAWQQGASVATIPALALAFGWVVVACIELCTIPLGGSLALTRWREKPINLLAVIGLCGLSMFTVYEFNESASFNLTRGARLAVIENENDIAEINRNNSRAEDFDTNSDSQHAWMPKVKEQYREELKSHSDQRAASLGEIDAKIALLDTVMRGGPLLTERLDELKIEIDRKREDHARVVDRQVATFESTIEALERDKERVGGNAQAGVLAGASTGGIDELKTEINRKREDHARIVDRQVATFESAIKALEIDKERVGPNSQAGVPTGAFTGGAEKVAKMQKQYDSMLKQQAELQQKIQETVSSQPDVSGELAMIREIESQRASGTAEKIAKMQKQYDSMLERQAELQRKIQETISSQPDVSGELAMIWEIESQRDSETDATNSQKNADIALLRVERQTAFDEWQVKRAAIELAYQLKVREYQDSVESEGKRAEGRKDKSDTLRAGIITRTKATDAQFEPILYYRMAKWFHSGDGLPTKEDYAQVQWFIFAPIGLFYSIVSIALAYLGMTMQNHGSDELAHARVTRNSVRRENRLRDLDERNLMLEEQACNQSMDLVAMRQEAFAAIKQIPQVVKLHEPDTARSSKALVWLPWCACMLMSLVALGAVAYSVNRPLAAKSINFDGVPVSHSDPAGPVSSPTFDSLLDPVVMIQTEDGVGSGFFIQADGLLLTNNHVIDGATEISVLTRQGPSFLGTVVGIDESRDLALVKIDANNMPTLSLSATSSGFVGQDVMVIGSPLGLEWSVSKGIVSSIRSNDGVTFLQTDAAMNHGNSGGPLIHLATRTVLGINTLKLDESSAYGIGFAVSADEVRKAFPNLR